MHYLVLQDDDAGEITLSYSFGTGRTAERTFLTRASLWSFLVNIVEPGDTVHRVMVRSGETYPLSNLPVE